MRGTLLSAAERGPVSSLTTAAVFGNLWGLGTALVVSSVGTHLTRGVAAVTLGDLGDDTVPFLVVFVTFVVLPTIVFRRDLRESSGSRDDAE